MLPRQFDKIIGIQVFLERKSIRLYVGLLRKIHNTFVFEYAKSYLKRRGVIPLGPEMPLTRMNYQSDQLFIPFTDRIPSRENPAYADYCKATGILRDETDPLILLCTIAHRGPSSFIFEPLYDDSFSSKDLLDFRQSLGLSVKEFAACFDLSPAAITRTELNQSTGREVLKRASIYARYPNVALDQLRLRGGCLHPNKYKKADSFLRDN
jgi:hypothetical protein